MKIIVLAGGGGTRLYPLSMPEKPKQFLPLAEGQPLLINTINRFNTLCKKSDIVIVTGEKHREITTRYLHEYNCNDVHVVYEPCAKNTAPAIALAVRYCKDILKCDEKESIFVVPSDHVISPNEEYLKLVAKAIDHTKNGGIAILGITPNLPDVGFGYIKAEKTIDTIKKVIEFKEKPTLEIAKEYLKSGNYYWNAGMFGFDIAAFERELQTNVLTLFSLYSLGYSDFYLRFPDSEKISVDYAIAEKSKNIHVIPMNIKWSDIGGFKAYYDFCDKDESGNVVLGDVTVDNCKGCFIYSDKGNLKITEQENKIIVNANGNMILLNM